MPKIVVEIEWDYPDEKHWLSAYSIEGVLGNHCKNTAFKVVEFVTEDKDLTWPETRYAWASIINHLACLYIDGKQSLNELDFATDMIEAVTPYLGLAEE